ncbi:recombinase family protein, partial [Escherichia coli]|nr:recombinase family protein [Escherichia coli]
GVDLSSAVGQAVLGVMASFAQMERKLILERQAAGIEAAKSRGQKFGRPPKIGAEEAGETVMGRAMGVPSATIAKQLNLSRSAIYRHLEKVDAVAPE